VKRQVIKGGGRVEEKTSNDLVNGGIYCVECSRIVFSGRARRDADISKVIEGATFCFSKSTYDRSKIFLQARQSGSLIAVGPLDGHGLSRLEDRVQVRSMMKTLDECCTVVLNVDCCEQALPSDR
jgi:hypothetical protein